MSGRTTILIDMPDDVWRDVQAAAKRRGVSGETLTGYLVEQYVSREIRGEPIEDPEMGLPGHPSPYCRCTRCTPPVSGEPADREEAARWARSLTVTASRMLARADALLAAAEVEPESDPAGDVVESPTDGADGTKASQ